MSGLLKKTSKEVESQSISAIIGGFGFASAIAWMDVTRALVAHLSKRSGLAANGGIQSVLIALLTTLMSVLVVMLVGNRASKTQPNVMYAVR